MEHKIPLGAAIASAIEYIKAHGKAFFAGISAVIRGSVNGVNAALRGGPGASC